MPSSACRPPQAPAAVVFSFTALLLPLLLASILVAPPAAAAAAAAANANAQPQISADAFSNEACKRGNVFGRDLLERLRPGRARPRRLADDDDDDTSSSSGGRGALDLAGTRYACRAWAPGTRSIEVYGVGAVLSSSSSSSSSPHEGEGGENGLASAPAGEYRLLVFRDLAACMRDAGPRNEPAHRIVVDAGAPPGCFIGNKRGGSSSRADSDVDDDDDDDDDDLVDETFGFYRVEKNSKELWGAADKPWKEMDKDDERDGSLFSRRRRRKGRAR